LGISQGQTPISRPHKNRALPPVIRKDRRPEQRRACESAPLRHERGEEVATRKAYGRALVRLAERFPHLIALDAEVSNSTYAEALGKAHASAGWLDLRINPRPV
jgi:transketolase